MKVRVALTYGIFTGPHVGIAFRKELINAGYEIVTSTHIADIIIAHSAGCFWLPNASKKQKLLLINPPYWPGRSMNERVRARLVNYPYFRQRGQSFKSWLVRTFWAAYYIVTDVPRSLRIIKRSYSFDLKEVLKGRRVHIIRNEHDDLLTPRFDELGNEFTLVTMTSLPGDHDDCWANPMLYIAELQKL